MGKAASAQSKEGYETVPVVDAAEEAAQFMTSGKKAGKPAKPVAPVEERSWESHLFCCFGRCDSVGWSSCLISYFAPCVAFGLNMRRGLVLSALKQALIFGILVALSWSLNGIRMASIVSECPPPFQHHMQHHHGLGHGQPFGRPFGPGFGHPAAVNIAVSQPMEPRDMSASVVTSGPMTTLDAIVPAAGAAPVLTGFEGGETTVFDDGKPLFKYDGPARSRQEWAAIHALAHSATAQHVVHPEDKAAARALGLCMKLKDGGAYVRFKAKRLREHDLKHSETTGAKAFKHAVVHLEEREGPPLGGDRLPWWNAALGKGARKHRSHGHGHIKHHKHEDEEAEAAVHKFRNLLEDAHDDEDDDDHDDEDDPEDDHEDDHDDADKATASVASTVDAPLDIAKLMHDHHDDMHRMFAAHMTPEHAKECRRLHGMAVQVSMALLLYLIGLTIYAARRRTELRERFNIAGSALGDFCAWCWCPTMALCQETRTLAANNVEAGVWHGPVPSVAAVQYTATTPPKVSVMSMFEGSKGGDAMAVDTVRMV